jgi:hypothetical protein
VAASGLFHIGHPDLTPRRRATAVSIAKTCYSSSTPEFFTITAQRSIPVLM